MPVSLAPEPSVPARATVSILLAGIRAYQLLLSQLFAGACRFHPNCSAYASEAIERHGPAKGGFLALKRLARCHPLCRSGYDPVP